MFHLPYRITSLFTALSALALQALVSVALVASPGEGIAAPTVTVLGSVADTQLRDITGDATNVYVTGVTGATAHVYAMGSSGGAILPLYTSTHPQGIASLGSNLYWADPQSGPGTSTQILAAPKAGGGPITPIYSGGAAIVDAFGLASNGTQIFTADAVQGRVHRMMPDGSGLTQIGPNRYGGFFLGAHENYVDVWSDTLFIAESAVPTAAGCDGKCSPGVYTHSASDPSGAFATLIPGAFFSGDGPRGIGVDDDFIYVTQDDDIFQFDHAGALIATISSPEFHSLRGLLVLDGALMVVDNFGTSARVLLVGSALPEPSTLLLLACGALAIVARRHPRELTS